MNWQSLCNHCDRLLDNLGVYWIVVLLLASLGVWAAEVWERSRSKESSHL